MIQEEIIVVVAIPAVAHQVVPAPEVLGAAVHQALVLQGAVPREEDQTIRELPDQEAMRVRIQGVAHLSQMVRR